VRLEGWELATSTRFPAAARQCQWNGIAGSCRQAVSIVSGIREVDVPEKGPQGPFFVFTNRGIPTAMTGKAEEIRDMLAPTVQALGLELLGVEYAPSVGIALLRLYIDAEGRSVGIEDCEWVSREVSALLDVNDPIASEYTLEVSSPGIDRPLFGAAQFARFLGEQAKLSLRVPMDGRRRLQGRIASVEGDRVTIAEEKGEFTVAEANIEKARLVPDLVALGLAAQPKPGQRGKRRKNETSDE
jgi:ribosome maturation factor RimP